MTGYCRHCGEQVCVCGDTHFADDATLARLQELESKLAASEEARKKAEESANEREAWAHENGLNNAREGIQEVWQQETFVEYELPECDSKPLCKIKWWHDSGDMSVGIYPSSGWELAEDQNGTILELLIAAEQRAESAEKLIEDSRKQEPVAWMLSNPDQRNKVGQIVSFSEYNKDWGFDIPVFIQPPIPPELSEVMRERDGLKRKLAEQQAIIFNINHPSNLGNYSWADCMEKARNADMTELNRLLSEARKVPEDIAKDAARYRFIRNQDGIPTPEEFDAAVDADMLSASPTYKEQP